MFWSSPMSSIIKDFPLLHLSLPLPQTTTALRQSRYSHVEVPWGLICVGWKCCWKSFVSAGNFLTNYIFSLASASLQLQVSHPNMSLSLKMSCLPLQWRKITHLGIFFFLRSKVWTHFTLVKQFILTCPSLRAFYQAALLFWGHVGNPWLTF